MPQNTIGRWWSNARIAVLPCRRLMPFTGGYWSKVLGKHFHKLLRLTKFLTMLYLFHPIHDWTCYFQNHRSTSCPKTKGKEIGNHIFILSLNLSCINVVRMAYTFINDLRQKNHGTIFYESYKYFSIKQVVDIEK